MNHSYEEIRAAALDILASREKTTYEPTQYEHLRIGVAEVLLRREAGSNEALEKMRSGEPPYPSAADSELFLEVFWDLFRQGIITLGLNDSSREFPWFRVSKAGSNIITNQGVYFFHDVSSYTKLITDQIPGINSVTLVYLKEAMQAYRSGCLLSATVMLGVATEHTFNLLLEAIEQSPTHPGPTSEIIAK